MKTRLYPCTRSTEQAAATRLGTACSCLLLFALPAVVQAQFNYVTNGFAITITGYTGPGGALNIPSIIDGLPVTGIGDAAFFGSNGLTSVTIPDSVTDIGRFAFAYTGLTNVAIPRNVTSIGEGPFDSCTGLTAILVDAANSAYANVAGVLFDASETTLIAYPPGRACRYTIPDSVTSIANLAFDGCTNLTSVTMGSNVSRIGQSAFRSCAGLAEVYFQGNAPAYGCNLSGCPFAGAPATAYYLPRMTGWGPTFAGLPTALWQPQPQTGDPSFGVGTIGFGFTFNWVNGMTVVVDGSTNLDNPTWIPLATNTLSSGSSYFSDPQWTNYPVRFYRLRRP